MENEEIRLIFTGSNLQASYLESFLNDNDISTYVRDSLAESLRAGWVSGAQEDSTRIYVNTEYFEKATSLVKEFVDSFEKAAEEE